MWKSFNISFEELIPIVRIKILLCVRDAMSWVLLDKNNKLIAIAL